MKILALDTATENCSAALWTSGAVLQREAEAERGHAELILTMIDELLKESATRLSDLTAIAFGRGPGSFTGVRLAASVTQGLAFGAGVPVVPVSDLRAVAQRVAAEHVLVCNDARMQEVYWACFERGPDGLMQPASDERVSKPSDVNVPQAWAGKDITGAGRGFAAYTLLQERLAGQLSNIEPTVLPRAREVVLLAVEEVRGGRLQAPELAVPTYIRDDVAKPKAP
jgi:tRNA threonylcarbamoyladenosine biosynthesis protein TsaB